MRREFRPSRIVIMVTVVIFLLLLGVAIFLEHARYVKPVDIHSSSSTLSIRSNPLNLFVASTV